MYAKHTTHFNDQLGKIAIEFMNICWNFHIGTVLKLEFKEGKALKKSPETQRKIKSEARKKKIWGTVQKCKSVQHDLVDIE